MNMSGGWTQELTESVVRWTRSSPDGADSYNAWLATEAAKQHEEGVGG